MNATAYNNNTATYSSSRPTYYIDGPFLDLISTIKERTNAKLAQQQLRPARNTYNGALTYRIGQRFDREFRQVLGRING